MGALFHFLALIPKDKLLHSFYGTLLYSLLSLALTYEIAFATVVVIAFLKEVYDEISYGGASMWDYLLTIGIPMILYYKTLIG